MSASPGPPESLVLVLPGGARYPVVDFMTIGRGDDATIKIDDQTVSRMHARIEWSPEGPMIVDAGSRFGITISGQQLDAPRRLLAGQEIRIGNVVLRVESVTRRPEAPAGAGGVPVAVPGAAGVPGAPGRGASGPSLDEPPPANATIVVPVDATEARHAGARPGRARLARCARDCAPGGR